MPSVQRLSFSATGTPASGPGSSPDPTMRSTASASAMAFSAVIALKQCRSPSRSATRSSELCEDRPGADLARADGRRDPGHGPDPGRLPRRHGASPMMRGTWKRSPSASGACARTVARSRLGATLSGGARSRPGTGGRSAERRRCRGDAPRPRARRSRTAAARSARSRRHLGRDGPGAPRGGRPRAR